MTIAVWSFIIAVIALFIAIWGRIETYFTVTRQVKLEQSRRIGTAFVSAQVLLNSLSTNITELEILTKDLSTKNSNDLYLKEFNRILEILNSDYEKTKGFLETCEYFVKEFERGNSISMKPTIMEAKIAVFNQRREVALNEIEYIKNYIKKQIK